MIEAVGFGLYLFFTASWFLHLTARVPFLGALRLDALLVGAIACIVLCLKLYKRKGSEIESQKYINMLILYILLTIPLVRWPGSVIKVGTEVFIKAIVFYYFTVSLVNSEKKLKVFMAVFLLCQTFRVLEPLYLHITEGYWGSAAYAAGETMDRLAGGPYDIVNPNGLAFIIVTLLPFLYYLSLVSWRGKVIHVILLPLLVYALVLTASRSGMICFGIIWAGVLLKSRYKLLLGTMIVVIAIVAVHYMPPGYSDRYLSVFSDSTSHSGTAISRVNFTKDAFLASLDRPLFGHGLGSSAETNWHIFGRAQITHNLYIEIAQELGYLGLLIFLLYMKSIIYNFRLSVQDIGAFHGNSLFLLRFVDAMQVWLLMTIIFSFASYGLSTYAWYLFGGLSVVFKRITDEMSGVNSEADKVLS